MSVFRRVRSERRLLGILLGLTVLPTIGLVWLGWELVALDRSLADAQIRDRLESTVAAAISAMRRDVDKINPADLDLPPDAGALVVEFRADEVSRRTGSPLVFTPAVPAFVEPSTSAWLTGQHLEDARNRPAALAHYRALARSADDGQRAGALVRIARVLRTAGDDQAALEVYRDLAALERARVFGEPAPLLAGLARLRTLETMGRTHERDREATSIAADLAAGRWPIDRISFEVAWGHVSDAPLDAPPIAEAVELATAVDALWAHWRRGGSLPSTWGETHGVLWSGRGNSNSAIALVASTRFWVSRWSPDWRKANILLDLIAPGEPVEVGKGLPDGRGAFANINLSPDETGLPWTIRATVPSREAEVALQTRRHSLLAAVLATAAFLVLAGVYFVARGVRGELQAARLQANFIAAVSHELRTPITSMSHLIELLAAPRGVDEATRQRYYGALAQEAGRLRRFVDRLLSLGRAEARSSPYALERLDPVDVVSDVVAEFRSQRAAGGRRVLLDVCQVSAVVDADRQAISLALHNLLDNAANYTPAGTPITIELSELTDARVIVIRVHDEGPGVQRDERERIFEKFVRGSAALQSGAQGTGVGLPLAREIARAHGGNLTLDEDGEGAGCTFTLTLPTARSDRSDVSQPHRSPTTC